MPGEQVSIMVDGVQVALPSYEEAVYGSAGNCIPSASSRVQIVLSEGAGEEQDNLQQEVPDSSIPGQSVHNTQASSPAMPHNSQCTAGSSQRSETVLVHQTSSQWVSGAHNRTLAREGADSESSDVQSLLSLSSEEYTDGKRTYRRNIV